MMEIDVDVRDWRQDRCTCGNCLDCLEPGDFLTLDDGTKLPVVSMAGFCIPFEPVFKRYRKEDNVPRGGRKQLAVDYSAALLQHRTERGLTQKQVADAIGIRRQAYTKIESGYSMSWHRVRQKIEVHLGVKNPIKLSDDGMWHVEHRGYK